jgi:hypothetical protein
MLIRSENLTLTTSQLNPIHILISHFFNVSLGITFYVLRFVKL